jgi:hypothetical protein
VKEVAATITKDPLDSLVVKFEKAFEFADKYKMLFEKTLRAYGVKFKFSDKKEGNIILTFAIEPICFIRSVQ